MRTIPISRLSVGACRRLVATTSAPILASKYEITTMRTIPISRLSTGAYRRLIASTSAPVLASKD